MSRLQHLPTLSMYWRWDLAVWPKESCQVATSQSAPCSPGYALSGRYQGVGEMVGIRDSNINSLTIVAVPHSMPPSEAPGPTGGSKQCCRYQD